MTDKAAKLTLDDGQEVELPVLEGTEHEKAIDISALRKKTGYVTYDDGFVKGILHHRGYPIEALAESCTFTEVSYLLMYGELPTRSESEAFRKRLSEHSDIHEDMKHFFTGYPSGAHPMSIMSAMVTSLSTFYPTVDDDDWTFDDTAARLIAKVRTIAAFSYRKAIGKPYVYPRADLNYASNFLNMMFSGDGDDYEIDPVLVRALTRVLILHADHEQNCSTSAVRLVGSSRANLYASIGAGISALSGPLHGGAAQAVVEMLLRIEDDGNDVDKYVAMAKDKTDSFRLMGFGHRVYKNYDPRAKIIKASCDQVFDQLRIQDPLLDIAKKLEKVALEDEYFVKRSLYPNVDFYSGILYRAMGIPVNMFTVIFAIGRLPGWIAHWRESSQDPDWRIWRPRQVYEGAVGRTIVPMDER
jgi:citrate synthase